MTVKLLLELSPSTVTDYIDKTETAIEVVSLPTSPRNYSQHRYFTYETNMEVTIVEVQQRRPHASVVLIGVYRPRQAKSHWFDLFNDLTLHLLTRDKLIIMGDTN